MIRLARIEGGSVIHLTRWVGVARWRSECNRVSFSWENGQEVGQASHVGGRTSRALFEPPLDRPLCADCLRRVDADFREVERLRAEAPR